MSFLVVGLSHRTASVPLLERAALSGDALTKLHADALDTEHVREVAVLSTCNRVEVCTVVDKFHGGLADVSDLLARHTGLGLSELTPYLYVHYEDRAVQHLFSVACGLESMVVGESQILGQVRSALALAQELGTVGRELNELLQQALHVGKRAHTETGIDQAGRSLVSIGLERARAATRSTAVPDTRPWPARRAMVVGAGSMSALAATTLAREGFTDIVVANRTFGRAARLAAAIGGRAVPIAEVGAALADTDIVVSCTGSPEILVDAEQVASAVTGREGRPLVLLDLALPRDLAPEIGEIPGAVLIDLTTLADGDGAVRGNEEAFGAQVEAVRRIVVAEVSAFGAAARASAVAPTVVALRSMAADVVSAELMRLQGRLPELDQHHRDEITRAVRRVVDKLLHGPTVRVKELATGPDGQAYAEALRELFDLDPGAVDAVTRAERPADDELERRGWESLRPDGQGGS